MSEHNGSTLESYLCIKSSGDTQSSTFGWLHKGQVYYDPGIKLEGASTATPRAKKRSQFRVSSKDLGALYATSRVVDACAEADG